MSTGQSALLDHVFGGNKALYETVGLLPLVTVGVYGINYAAKSISSKFAKKSTQKIAEETAERLARESIEEAAEKAFKEAGEEAAKKTAMEAGEELSEKAAMEAGEELSEKAAMEAADNADQINTTTQEVAENQNSGVYLESGIETELLLPNKYYKELNKDMHKGYQDPNTREVYRRLGNTSNEIETSIAISDQFGRIQYRIDYSTHGRDLSHTNPHIHEFVPNLTKDNAFPNKVKYFLDNETGRMRPGKSNEDGTYIWFD